MGQTSASLASPSARPLFSGSEPPARRSRYHVGNRRGHKKPAVASPVRRGEPSAPLIQRSPLRKKPRHQSHLDSIKEREPFARSMLLTLEVNEHRRMGGRRHDSS